MRTKAIGITLVVIAAISLIIALVVRAKEEEQPKPPEPPEPPPEGTGRIQGYVLNGNTGNSISYPTIHVDGNHNTYGDIDGAFRTSYIDFGLHTIKVFAKDYTTGEFQVDLAQTLLQRNFELYPVGNQGGFPDDIQVTGINIWPQTPLAGQEVAIGVALLGPYPDSYPREVTGTITVDGIELTQTITMRYRNPSMVFRFTPPSAGTYSVRAAGRSATFEVLADTPGTFYSPFGCIPLEGCYWQSENALIEAIAFHVSIWDLTYPYKKCAIRPRWYGSGSTSTKSTTIYCPYCCEPIKGQHRDYYAIAAALLRHIEGQHPELPFSEPPAWIIPLTSPEGKGGWISVDGQRLRGSWPMALEPGTYTVRYGYWETPVSEWEVTVNWGDRVSIDIEAGTVSTKTWQELCPRGSA